MREDSAASTVDDPQPLLREGEPDDLATRHGQDRHLPRIDALLLEQGREELPLAGVEGRRNLTF